jgi:hypothetical protein
MRAPLAPRLPNAAEIVRGALLKPTIHHRQGCAKCQRGGGRTVCVLTVSRPGGQTRQFRIRPEPRAPVQKWLENYQQLKARREAIGELHHDLLRPER